MPSPETDLIITLGIIILVGFAIAFFISFVIAMFFFFRSKQRVNALEVVFKEQLELCRVNHNSNLRILWLIPVPPMFNLLDSVDAFKEKLLTRAEQLKSMDDIKVQLTLLKPELAALSDAVYALVQKYRTGAAIYKGDIIGSNVIDKQATLDELYERPKETDGSVILKDNATGEVVQKFTKEEITLLEQAIKENGRHLNLFAYERDTGKRFMFLFAKKDQFIVNAYDNQVLLPGMSRQIEIKAAAGDVSLLAPGTTRYGKFEFLTGYPINTKLQAVELKTIVWTMVNRQIIGNIAGAVQDAFDMNVGFSQGTTYEELKRPIQQQKPERGGG